MYNVIYLCKMADDVLTVKANNIPQVGDVVLLKLQKIGVARFKVVGRIINHSGETFNGMQIDTYYIDVEMI
jgi:hypothetical protein